MNYDDFTDRLSEGFDPIDEDRLSAIRDRVVADTTPVKPLPSDAILIGFLASIFAVFTLIAAYFVHMRAPHVLTPAQMMVYYGVIFICAVEGAAVMVGEMIPGSELRSRRWLWIAATAVGLPLVCVVLFRSYDTWRFLHFGLPCFEIGSGSAVVGGGLFSLVLRRGFPASQRSAARAIGFFGALAGVAVLALHCPLLSVAHIAVFHFSVLLFGLLIGDLVGQGLESR